LFGDIEILIRIGIQKGKFQPRIHKKFNESLHYEPKVDDYSFSEYI